ncbi:hypothetical protein [Streptomyces clavifer]|uniref:hypothetical protein n=1 Tax=Streptomyces clavifer TaxID=68188 RepID=UPI0033B8A254
MQDARITINRDHTDRLGELLFGGWWWQVYVAGVGHKSGFARTEPRARVKAERAARKLACATPQSWLRYTLHVNAEGGDAQ